MSHVSVHGARSTEIDPGAGTPEVLLHAKLACIIYRLIAPSDGPGNRCYREPESCDSTTI